MRGSCLGRSHLYYELLGCIIRNVTRAGALGLRDTHYVLVCRVTPRATTLHMFPFIVRYIYLVYSFFKEIMVVVLPKFFRSNSTRDEKKSTRYSRNYFFDGMTIILCIFLNFSLNMSRLTDYAT